ncbi:HCLS1-associated protein X-1 [Phasianus colchicus]|uniref:HCLS1 associated protein X-1 n=1 Tax=Phasianus colchicus TaxID=9054 RepID=A0A669QL41_PHACC|nr:HCLS1-associated protein X-1 [Phasianus colchicus]
MSFYDAFRGFFGFPGRGRPRDPLFGAPWDEDEDEEEEAEAPPGPRPPDDFAFGFGFSPGGAFEELLRDMGELLGAFGGGWAGLPPAFGGERGWGAPGGAARPGLTPALPAEPPLPGPGAGRPLRDSMLKEPEGPARQWEPRGALEEPPPPAPGQKEDRDLDSQVSSAGLGTILRPQQPLSYFQSVSVTTVTLPDGAVEERRTVQDSQGHRETTITRRRGDQAFITTTKEDGQSKDYREEVLNMDDRELAQFAGTWPQRDELLTPPRSDSSSLLGSFFRRWFSSW